MRKILLTILLIIPLYVNASKYPIVLNKSIPEVDSITAVKPTQFEYIRGIDEIELTGKFDPPSKSKKFIAGLGVGIIGAIVSVEIIKSKSDCWGENECVDKLGAFFFGLPIGAISGIYLGNIMAESKSKNERHLELGISTADGLNIYNLSFKRRYNQYFGYVSLGWPSVANVGVGYSQNENGRGLNYRLGYSPFFPEYPVVNLSISYNWSLSKDVNFEVGVSIAKQINDHKIVDSAAPVPLLSFRYLL